ncbi:hypothetical protein [uncultured Tessaracoccus sp.]|uniref:hypothetical protein n=1 Tax=uncultured Tessaracoccus sp. TaxID=905023 RepID=UPI00261BDE3D|nr:hypothetical protein [uncultured Tessaracoccus sp.]
MSNQQWPGGQPGQPDPWSRNDPNWRPPHFEERVERDPRQPFGQRPSTPPVVPDFEPPRKPVWPWVAAIIGAVAVLLIVLVVQPAQPEPEASEQPPASAFPSPSVTGNAIPYDGNGTGIVEITSHRWTSDGLELGYSITTDQQSRRFSFFVFTNETRESYAPEGEPVITVSPGAPTTGTLEVRMPRGDATLVLTTANGRAITALPIPG